MLESQQIPLSISDSEIYVTPEGHILPKTIPIDLNADGTNDFILKYEHWWLVQAIHPKGHVLGVMVLILEVMEDNSYLISEDDYIFPQSLDEIKVNVSEPYRWSDSTPIVMDKYNIQECGWLDWVVHTENDLDSYIIGLRLDTGNGFEIGWIEFDADATTGALQILALGIL